MKNTDECYCSEFELSSCNKRICCYRCDDKECKERCHHYSRYKNKCGSETKECPLSFDEIMYNK